MYACFQPLYCCDTVLALKSPCLESKFACILSSLCILLVGTGLAAAIALAMHGVHIVLLNRASPRATAAEIKASALILA